MSTKPHEREAKQTVKAANASIEGYIGDAMRAAKAVGKQRQTAKSVHDFRVAARRSMVCLDIYASFLQDSFCRGLRRDINHLRKQCGRIRDREIFLKIIADLSPKFTDPELFAAYHGARATRRKLKQLQKSAYRDFAEGAAQKIQKRCQKYFASSEVAALQSGKLSEFAPLVISRELKEIYKLFAMTERDDTFESIHDLRRQFKKLRYTLDSLQQHMPTVTPSHLYATLVEAQDVLGKLADYDMCLNILQKLTDKQQKSRKDEQELGFALLTARLTMLVEHQHDIFLDLWRDKIGDDYGYELLKAWGLRESTAKWVLGKATVVSLRKPKIVPRSPRKTAVAMGSN